MNKAIVTVLAVFALLATAQPAFASRLPKERKATVKEIAKVVAKSSATYVTRPGIAVNFAVFCEVTLGLSGADQGVVFCADEVNRIGLAFQMLEISLGLADKRSVAKNTPNSLYVGSIPKSIKRLRAQTLATTEYIIEDATDLARLLRKPDLELPSRTISATVAELSLALGKFDEWSTKWRRLAGLSEGDYFASPVLGAFPSPN